MDVRVRLVFADEVGRHVLRRRGFSSCWYLVPTDAKLVGDLAHALLREFDLRQRCPKGLELRLQELPLLATQSIRLVRDDDTIVVQCPPLEDVVSDKELLSSSSESETEVESTQRKRKPKLKQAQQLKKRIKRVQHALVDAKEILGVESKPREIGAGKAAVPAKTSSRVKSSSSSSSSSSESEAESSSESSSSSSSDTSESEDEAAEQQNRKRATTAAPARTARTKEAASAKSSASNGAASNTNAPAQTAKEPRRRRRRLRQRNGRRQRNCDQANSVPSDSNAATSEVHERTTEESKETSGARVGSDSVGPRGYPRAKAHVLFDEVTGDQVVVQRDDNLPSENTWTARRSQIPELAKYGPSSSGNYQSSRGSRARTPASFDGQLNDKEASNDPGAPKRKGKGKYEEMWKRPYEIVATVLDDNTENSSSSTEDLTKSLASYPTATASSCNFKPTDILAYKTLRLCLETWQPVLSEWQCGQVESVDASGNSIELSRWTIEVNGDSLSFNEAPGSEPCSVQTSEISELRFLSGPSYSSRQ